MNVKRYFTPDSHKILNLLQTMDSHEIIKLATQALGSVLPAHAIFQTKDPLQTQQDSVCPSVNPGDNNAIELQKIVSDHSATDEVADVSEPKYRQQRIITPGFTAPVRSASLPAHLRFPTNRPFTVAAKSNIPEPPARSRSRHRSKELIHDEIKPGAAAVENSEPSPVLKLHSAIAKQSSVDSAISKLSSPSKSYIPILVQPQTRHLSDSLMNASQANAACGLDLEAGVLITSGMTANPTPSTEDLNPLAKLFLSEKTSITTPSNPILTKAQLNYVFDLRKKYVKSPSNGTNTGPSPSKYSQQQESDHVAVTLPPLDRSDARYQTGESSLRLSTNPFHVGMHELAADNPATIPASASVRRSVAHSLTEVELSTDCIINVSELSPPSHKTRASETKPSDNRMIPHYGLKGKDAAETSQGTMVIGAAQSRPDVNYRHFRSVVDVDKLGPPPIPTWDEEDDSTLAQAKDANRREKKTAAKTSQGAMVIGAAQSRPEVNYRHFRSVVDVDKLGPPPIPTWDEEDDSTLAQAKDGNRREEKTAAETSQGTMVIGAAAAASQLRFGQV